MLDFFQLNLASALFMTGLIWFVQLVHYPLFSSVPSEPFLVYERLHAKRTTWIVAPVMLLELATGVILAAAGSQYLGKAASWANLGLLGVIWISTATLQIPLHGLLANGFSRETHRRLVSGDWIRTAAWTARSILPLASVGAG
jgi:hypothetical protein